MQKFHIDVIKGKGSYYQLGQRAGALFQQTPLYQTHLKRRESSKKAYQLDRIKAESYIKAFAPGLWDELYGLSSELKWPFEDVVHEYSGWQQDWKKSGCSVLMKNGFFVRNYDYHPKTYEGRLMIWQPDNGYASIGVAGRMIGRIDGMNEKGLCVGFHFVNRKNPGEGFTCSVIARFLLDSCATTQEAVSMLKEIPHRHAFNYTVFDAQGNHAIVEASPLGVAIRPQITDIACTNHFQTAEKVNENRYQLKESKARLQNIYDQSAFTDTAIEAFYRFNDPTYGIFKKNYGSWSGTIHTVVYDPIHLNVIFGAGENAVPLTINFKDWLAGERYPVTKIFGEVDTGEQFSHVNRSS
ncbi:acyl-CoA--6-aminopenicillanic acid acyl-transferase [Jeotgalibacillus salarius]|uniref:Acyl-CoA--6-aminopenicillanic acid acyl-transferase n=2 Tax=Jeotgalibacillus salarius TaxID=546023 RepID=A0A4Y8LK60_9BACL|nr:acyl-CoA--6-aminopenicillanic acid acyl-transferase [Jeotgalibacillus salarius]